ncbi:DUF4352 domain-containing protein [Nonomuraea aridisoli]|uniref:DUF4352 domain-containing protein n=1 Tax=Nonomuraea aridisoli TaxID=2070368 RepID=A0A2W2FG39_9ACTN|nr:DUF4352 domain-containing protein [Nonomuraea aridisoli]PZG20587.1 hypothetical protein C1J01_08775 [Nonomuraea aridisoli]
MRFIALLSAALLALLLGCGTPTVTTMPNTEEPTAEESSAEPTKATPKNAGPAKVGDTITLQGYEPAVKVAVTVAKVYPNRPGGEFDQPQDGHRFYAVQLVLKNVGEAGYGDSPGNGAYLIDSEGQQHSTTYASVQGLQGFEGTVTMGPGDTRRGVIVFEVPENAKIDRLQFALESGFADQKGEWHLR